MKAAYVIRLVGMLLGVGVQFTSQAQGVAGEIRGLHGVLDQLYREMLPLCSQLIGVGQGIAGFAALYYIAARVWRHLANADPIDFYPLFRPFVLGMAILLFPHVVGLINGVLQPTVSGTSALVDNSNQAIEVLLAKKEAAIRNSDVWQMYVGASGAGDRDRWYRYTHPEDPTGTGEGMFESVGNDIKFAMAKASYNFRNSIKEWMSEVLALIYEAAALCINTLRTFFLIVLAILGPLVFGLAVFDGLQHTLTVWIARYINIFLWLPVANIFGGILGKIQEQMIALDIEQIGAAGDTFFSATDSAYLIFLVIGIVGYFSVPSVANYIVHAGGGNAILYKVSSLFSASSRGMVQSTLGTGTSMVRDVYGEVKNATSGSMAGAGQSGGYFADKVAGK